MSWAERLAQERRARLAAEQLLRQREAELQGARTQLADYARNLAEAAAARRTAEARARFGTAGTAPADLGRAEDLERARAAAAAAERRLWESIEAIRDGFAVFDAGGRLIGANRAYLAPFQRFPDITPGVAYADILTLCAREGLVDTGPEGADAWIARMLARWQQDRIAPELIRFCDGPWVRLVDRRARGGDMVCLALDVTEAVEQAAALREATQRAEAASRAKSTFLANMSHELRTPMNGVVGMAEMLCDSALGDEQRLYAETIRNSGEALLRIINDVLDYSRLEADRLQLRPDTFDLDLCVQEVALMLQPAAREKGLDLRVDYDLLMPTRFFGDAGRLRQVLVNLMGNAVKFTASGHVLVRITGLPEDGMTEGRPLARLHLAVEDTGIGIAPEHFDHVFGEFNQVESEASRAFDGTGLGLAITRELVQLMGGEIWLDSTPGKGACFGVSLHLPVAEPVPAAPIGPVSHRCAVLVDDRLIHRTVLQRGLEAMGIAVRACRDLDEALAAMPGPPAADVVIADADLTGTTGAAVAETLRAGGWEGKVILLSQTPEVLRASLPRGPVAAVLAKPVLRRDLLAALGGPPPAEAGAAPPASSAQMRRMRVLSAEDNRTNQLVFAKMVRDLDIDLTFASDGHEAVALYQSLRPDLVFMDISMPGMDGRDATREIRRIEAAERLRPVPVVALTAHAMEGDREDILAAGLDDYMTKPLRRAAICERILAHCPPGIAPPQGVNGPAAQPAAPADAPVS